MKQWMQTLQATVEFVSEMVDREWRTQDEWLSYSAVQRSLFAQVAQWLEAFAEQPLFTEWGVHREQQRLLARQVRDELFLLLGELEPAQAMAVLCSLPAAQVMGYQQDRLATLLTVEAEHVEAWEQEGFARLQELVSPRTPLLQFVAQRVAEVGGSVEAQDVPFAVGRELGNERVGAPFLGRAGEMGLGGQPFGGELGDERVGASFSRRSGEMGLVGPSSGGSVSVVGSRPNEVGHAEEAGHALPVVTRTISEADLPLLIQEARVRPHFDLRQFVLPALELSIRQALHQHGLDELEQVQALFAKEDHAIVQLVAVRLKVEMSGGKEESTND